jgi:Fe-S-cluster containining protein
MYGADVEVDEYDRLIKHELATPADFTGPEIEDGIFLYRTAQGPRGCIFLLPERGCRLHGTDFKPRVCRIFPRDEMEMDEAYQDGYLPCARAILHPQSKTPKDR